MSNAIFFKKVALVSAIFLKKVALISAIFLTKKLHFCIFGGVEIREFQGICILVFYFSNYYNGDWHSFLVRSLF